MSYVLIQSKLINVLQFKRKYMNINEQQQQQQQKEF